MPTDDDLPVHPLADLFPAMDPDQFEQLKADISAHGVREPVWVYRGRLIDGRHRHRASRELGIICPTREYAGDEAGLTGFVLSLNLHRRHLDTSERAMIGAKLATMRQGERTDQPSRKCGKVSQAEAAKLLKVSPDSIGRAKAVLEDGSPELLADVRAGRVSVSAAAKTLRSPGKTVEPPPDAGDAWEPPASDDPAPCVGDRPTDAGPGRSASTTPPAEVVLDEKGRTVPPHLLPVFAERTRIRSLVGKLAHVLGDIDAGYAARDGDRPGCAEWPVNAIRHHAKSLSSELTAASPHVLCPRCGGAPGCRLCSGRGWVTRLVYQQFGPKDKAACEPPEPAAAGVLAPANALPPTPEPDDEAEVYAIDTPGFGAGVQA